MATKQLLYGSRRIFYRPKQIVGCEVIRQHYNSIGNNFILSVKTIFGGRKFVNNEYHDNYSFENFYYHTEQEAIEQAKNLMDEPIK
jgi:hypothetical protein